MPDTPATDAPQTPPWGDDFDPARAWSLITNLRAEIADEKAAHAETKASREALAEEKTAAETAAAEANAARETAEATATGVQRDLWVERAVRKHDLDEDLIEFLTGDTEEAVASKAERLAGRSKPKKDADGDDADGETPPSRPEPGLAPVPGHGGAAPEPVDHAAIAAAARRQ